MAALLTAIFPDCLEAVVGVDPDHGFGAIEWQIVAALAATALVTGSLAWRNIWRRKEG